MTGLQRYWVKIRDRTRLEGMRLLGHSQVQTTARYAHLARDSVREAASRIFHRHAVDDKRGFIKYFWKATPDHTAENAIGGET